MRLNLGSASRRSLRFLTLLSLLVIGFVARSQAAETPAASARPSYTDEQKGLLAALDAELVRFDAMLAKDTDAAHAAFVKTLIDGFKARRDAMNQAPTSDSSNANNPQPIHCVAKSGSRRSRSSFTQNSSSSRLKLTQ